MIGWCKTSIEANFVREKLSIDELVIREEGYLHIYFSYEEQANVPVSPYHHPSYPGHFQTNGSVSW